MPKTKRERSVSCERPRKYQVLSSCSHNRRTTYNFSDKEDLKQWEETRCPVCLEHPHNAVLLICSSYGKGCRPYMCDTSYRHTNCFDQFRKLAEAPSETLGYEMPGSSQDPRIQYHSHAPNITGIHKLEHKLTCPLCRGQISGWIVVEAARSCMNGKSRSCAHETCDFIGNYADLRKHARHNHPLVRPSEADPERQRCWRTLERQREFGDALSMMQSSFGHDGDYEDVLTLSEIPLAGFFRMTIFFLILGSGVSIDSSDDSVRSRNNELWGESYSTSDGGSVPEGGLGTSNRRGRQGITPDVQFRSRRT